jgi:hypothetical protein
MNIARHAAATTIVAAGAIPALAQLMLYTDSLKLVASQALSAIRESHAKSCASQARGLLQEMNGLGLSS